MKWLYVMLWGLLTAKELPPLWRKEQKGQAVLWLTFALIGLAMGVLCFWFGTDWRLAEWVLRE